jgi:predicted permease
MKPLNWKDAIELFGIAAIVASLIFVGLQLQQEQQIAVTETFGDLSQSVVDLNLEIGNHMDIWQRGLNGEE